MAEVDPTAATNPVSVKAADFEQLYRMAIDGDLKTA
jgi:hypothetical protein